MHKKVLKFNIYGSKHFKIPDPELTIKDMKVKFINSVVVFALIFCFSAFSAFAQESAPPVVVDEVIAQVNDSVITLSSVKKEMKTAADALVQTAGKKPDEAKAEVEKKEGEIIAGLINEELIMQKGKEIGADADADAQVNQRFLQLMKQYNLKTLDALYKAMNDQGVKPDELRELWKKQIIKDSVMQHEVNAKYYYGRGSKEIKDYYEAHKDKFTTPETVTLSEIFLGFAGRDTPTVRAKADQLIAQARSGADFTKLVAENSDRPDAAQTKGSVGTLKITELNPQVAEAIKGLKAGEVTKLDVDEGVEIIRVDNRVAASNDSVFDEDAVRSRMTAEALPAEQKKYLAELRKDAFIKVSENYRPLVAPLLDGGTAATAAEAKKPGK